MNFMRNIFSKATVLTLLLACGTAHAAGFEPGVYVGFDIGKSSYKQAGVNSSDPSFGLKLGYQATGYFGLELYGRSLSFQLDAPYISADYYPDDHFGVAAVATYPLASEFNLYGRLGMGRTQLRSPRVGNPTRHRDEASLGVGAAYLMTPKWQFSVEAVRFNKSEVTLLTAGVQYRF